MQRPPEKQSDSDQGRFKQRSALFIILQGEASVPCLRPLTDVQTARLGSVYSAEATITVSLRPPRRLALVSSDIVKWRRCPTIFSSVTFPRVRPLRERLISPTGVSHHHRITSRTKNVQLTCPHRENPRQTTGRRERGCLARKLG